MKTRIKKFIELKLMKDENKPTLSYSFQRTSNQFDLSRFIHQQPYWQKIIPNTEPQRQKLILNYWQALFQLDRIDGYLWDFLYDQGFKAYLRIGPYEFYEMTSFDMLTEKIQDIAFVDNSVIEAELTNPNDYLIIDHVVRKQLLYALGKYLDHEVDDINEKELILPTKAMVSQKSLRDLAYYAASKHFQIISYLFNERCKFVWTNTFEPEELLALLMKLLWHPHNDTICLDNSLGEKLQEFIANIDNADIVDVSKLKQIKVLALQRNTRHGKTEIVGFDNLTELQELRLTNLQLSMLDYKQYNKLRKLKLLLHNDIKALVLQQFSELEEFELDYYSPIDEVTSINVSFLHQLRILKLEIPDYLCKLNLIGLDNLFQLEELYLSDCNMIKLNISHLYHLHTLTVKYCDADQVIFPGTSLNCLKKILFSECKNSIAIDMENCINLKGLSLDNVLSKSLSNLGKCVNLEVLYIEDCIIESTIDVSSLRNLKTLVIHRSKVSILGIEHCTQLEKLHLIQLEGMSNLDITKLDQLNDFSVLYNSPEINIQAAADLADQLNFIQIFSEDKTQYKKNVYYGYSKINDNNLNTYRPTKQFPVKNTTKPLKIHIPFFIDKHDIVKSSLPKRTRIDRDTYTSPDQERQTTRLFFSLSDNVKNPSSRKYRLRVMDKIVLSETGEVGWQQVSLLESSLEPVNLTIYPDNNTKSYRGVHKLNLLRDQFSILPGFSANDDLLSISHSEDVQAYRDKATGQYIVGIKSDKVSVLSLPDFYFTINKRHKYFVPSFTHRVEEKIHVPELPAPLRHALDEALQNPRNKKLFALHTKVQNTHGDKDQIIPLLFSYVKVFKNHKLPEELLLLTGVEYFIRFMEESLGACRHAAIVLLVFLHYYRIPARGIENDIHAYVEIPVKDKHGTLYIAPEIGGAAVRHIESDHPTLSQLANIDKYNKTLAPVIATNVDRAKFNRPIPSQINVSVKSLVNWRALFLPHKKWVQAASPVELIHAMINHPKPILIRVHKKEEAWEWHHAFYKELHIQCEYFVYIDNASELISLYDTAIIRQTGIEETAGPLKRLIFKNKGVILINWSNFTATERATYKCMMDDTSPTLHDQRLSSRIRIIGLLEENINVNDVFLSRCDEVRPIYTLHAFQYDAYPKQQWLNGNAIGGEVVDLYQSSEWHKFLVEEFTINKNQFSVTPGPLINAIWNGEPITILNPPFHDASFCRFWHQITTENTVTFNGKIIPLVNKPEFHVNLQKNPVIKNPPANIIFDEQANHENVYYINTMNFNHLFDIQSIDDKDIIHTTPGWLKSRGGNMQFIIQTALTEDQWQRLYGSLSQTTQKIHIYKDTSLSQESDITMVSDISRWTKEQVKSKTNLHIETNDIEFVKGIFQKESNIPADNIFYLTNENSWSLLIEAIQPYRKNGHIYAKRQTMPFWNKLAAGETIILCGALPPAEYIALHSLFLPIPRLCVNGKQIDVCGRLIWVSLPNPRLATGKVARYHFDASLKDYETSLSYKWSNDVDTKKEIKLFLQCIEKAEKFNSSSIKRSNFTYVKYQAMYQCFDRNLWAENPLKPILQYYYRKGTEQYAFLNVMSKILLSIAKPRYVREIKLNGLINKIQSERDFQLHQWRIANCFSSKELRNFFCDSSSECREDAAGWPILSERSASALLTRLIRLYPQLQHQTWIQEKNLTSHIHKARLWDDLISFNPFRVDRHQKQQSKLKQALLTPEVSLILLLGETGTGKTYSAKKMVKKSGLPLYCGEMDIVKWLKTGGVLLLDEGTLEPTNKWEFLREHIKSSHKIIITSNPFYYPGRHFHSILWELAEVIWFGSFEPSFVSKKIQRYMQNALVNERSLLTPQMQTAMHLIRISYAYLCQQTRHVGEMTLRDVQNICARTVLLHQQTNASWFSCAQQSVYDEMAAFFMDDNARAEFTNFLQKQGGEWMKPSPRCLPQTKHLIIPPGKYDVWRMVEDDLALRKSRIAANTNQGGKLGTLIIGASGVGKSTLWEVALAQVGIKRDAANTQNCVEQITVGSKGVNDLLIKAFHDGSVVILDELNLDEELEKTLNQLLSGVDLNNSPAKKPGFMVLASQNPGKYDGCGPTLVAMTNRFHKIEMGDYSNTDLEYIAAKSNHPDPVEFVAAFSIERKLQPGMNARQFFQVLHKLPEESKLSQDSNICRIF